MGRKTPIVGTRRWALEHLRPEKIEELQKDYPTFTPEQISQVQGEFLSDIRSRKVRIFNLIPQLMINRIKEVRSGEEEPTTLDKRNL